LTLVFYISGHGLGHASRDIELIKAMLSRRPDARIVVRTSAQRWLFDLNAPAAIELQGLEADSGVVQIDSLRLDEEATAIEASRFYRDFDRRVREESDLLRHMRADVVLGDIPPLAFAAAARAGLPSVAIGNFTWDWIYSSYPAFERLAPDVLPTIRQAYAQATLALRLPLHGGFEAMAAVTRDIPFVARRATREREEIRRTLGLPGDRPVVLASFGAYGADIPVDDLSRSGRFTLLAPSREPPAGVRYQDLVAASDVVISKPGYGIVSECVANGPALLYTSRGRFAEYDVFVEQMPRVLRCRFISQEDLFAGRWADAIDALLAQPALPERPRVDGAEIAADRIVNLVIG
jgi:UDP:flavonoid glycosyltransferase YjiC (YdhE family)